MKKIRNIDLWSVRPAGLQPAVTTARSGPDSGVQLRWAHKAEPYVPFAGSSSVKTLR
jgi:hypothetical protein